MYIYWVALGPPHLHWSSHTNFTTYTTKGGLLLLFCMYNLSLYAHKSSEFLVLFSYSLQ